MICIFVLRLGYLTGFSHAIWLRAKTILFAGMKFIIISWTGIIQRLIHWTVYYLVFTYGATYFHCESPERNTHTHLLAQLLSNLANIHLLLFIVFEIIVLWCALFPRNAQADCTKRMETIDCTHWFRFQSTLFLGKKNRKRFTCKRQKVKISLQHRRWDHFGSNLHFSSSHFSCRHTPTLFLAHIMFGITSSFSLYPPMPRGRRS